MNNRAIAIGVYNHPLIQALYESPIFKSSVIHRLIVEEILNEEETPEQRAAQRKAGDATFKQLDKFLTNKSDDVIKTALRKPDVMQLFMNFAYEFQGENLKKFLRLSKEVGKDPAAAERVDPETSDDTEQTDEKPQDVKQEDNFLVNKSDLTKIYDDSGLDDAFEQFKDEFLTTKYLNRQVELIQALQRGIESFKEKSKSVQQRAQNEEVEKKEVRVEMTPEEIEEVKKSRMLIAEKIKTLARMVKALKNVKGGATVLNQQVKRNILKIANEIQAEIANVFKTVKDADEPEKEETKIAEQRTVQQLSRNEKIQVIKKSFNTVVPVMQKFDSIIADYEDAESREPVKYFQVGKYLDRTMKELDVIAPFFPSDVSQFTSEKIDVRKLSKRIGQIAGQLVDAMGRIKELEKDPDLDENRDERVIALLQTAAETIEKYLGAKNLIGKEIPKSAEQKDLSPAQDLLNSFLSKAKEEMQKLTSVDRVFEYFKTMVEKLKLNLDGKEVENADSPEEATNKAEQLLSKAMKERPRALLRQMELVYPEFVSEPGLRAQLGFVNNSIKRFQQYDEKIDPNLVDDPALKKFLAFYYDLLNPSPELNEVVLSPLESGGKEILSKSILQKIQLKFQSDGDNESYFKAIKILKTLTEKIGGNVVKLVLRKAVPKVSVEPDDEAGSEDPTAAAEKEADEQEEETAANNYDNLQKDQQEDLKEQLATAIKDRFLNPLEDLMQNPHWSAGKEPDDLRSDEYKAWTEKYRSLENQYGMNLGYAFEKLKQAMQDVTKGNKMSFGGSDYEDYEVNVGDARERISDVGVDPFVSFKQDEDTDISTLYLNGLVSIMNTPLIKIELSRFEQPRDGKDQEGVVIDFRTKDSDGMHQIRTIRFTTFPEPNKGQPQVETSALAAGGQKVSVNKLYTAISNSLKPTPNSVLGKAFTSFKRLIGFSSLEEQIEQKLQPIVERMLDG